MATTTNYGWVTPDDTALVKDGAAAIRTLGTSIDTTTFNNASAAIAKTIVDAKGDIIAATAADTVSRLAVGANDTVLTADSSTATGLKWALPAGGAGNLAQIATGTLSGATGASLTGLSSYTELLLTFTNVTWATASSQFLLRLNSNSGSNYAYYGGGQSSSTTFVGTFNAADTCFRFNKYTNQVYNDANNNYSIKLTNCKNAGFTDVNIISGYYGSGGGGLDVFETYRGIYKVSEAISSINLLISAGYSFNGGTYTLWGA
jgi:hypothetical protein